MTVASVDPWRTPTGASAGMVRFAVLAAMLGWCAVLVALRVMRTDSSVFVFLGWNLFLAAVPLAASTMLRWAERARAPFAVQALCAAVWLLFLPNAPYLTTDLIHLAPRPPVPLWYDLALLLSCAGTGLALGYASLRDVQDLVARRLGAAAGWAMAVGTLFLCGFGIYLGRYLRLNSWDVVVDPAGIFFLLLDRVTDPAAHLQTWAVTVLFGVLLTLGYVALHTRPPGRAGAGVGRTL